MAFSILSIDDELSVRKSLYYIFKDEFAFFEAENSAQGLELLKQNAIDLVFLDLNFPGEDGSETLQQIKTLYPDTEVMVLTASGDIHKAVQCIKLGAEDFLIKPLEVEQIRKRVQRLAADKELAHQNILLQSQMQEKTPGNFIGQSKPIAEMKKNIEKVAITPATVLILGESGTGKELVARMVHTLSPRKNKNFIAINCAAIPRDLLESDLFGHEVGAFTSATQRKIGKFELADGGTVFLDEISCMSLDLQGKLLRVLQERTIERVGGTQTIPVDFRLIAASNEKMEEKIKQGLFREDLYFRLKVVPIEIPPLRQRGNDIELLLHYFMDKYNRELNVAKPKVLHRETIPLLEKYHWPGNVRELENLVERLIILSPDTKIYPEDLPLEYRFSDSPQENGQSLSKSLKDAIAWHEKQIILEALKKNSGNQTKTAEMLGIHRNTLINKMEELMISKVGHEV